MDRENRGFNRQYLLTSVALDHIIKKYYNNRAQENESGRFEIDLSDLIICLKSAANQPMIRIPGSLYWQRVVHYHKKLGYDPLGCATSLCSVITDYSGKIITAYPGSMITAS
jgi:hypothetical protein